MSRLFDGKIEVGYHIFTLATQEAESSGLMPDTCMAGQANGLCGAAVPGALMFTTGLHHGNVGLTIDLMAETPTLDESWEEIVEASFMNDDEDGV